MPRVFHHEFNPLRSDSSRFCQQTSNRKTILFLSSISRSRQGGKEAGWVGGGGRGRGRERERERERERDVKQKKDRILDQSCEMEHPAYARPQRVKGVLDIAWSTVSAFSISHRRRVVFVFVRVAFSFDLPRAMLRDTHDRAVEKQVVRNQTRKMNFSKIVDSEPRHRRMRHVRLEIRCTAHRTK